MAAAAQGAAAETETLDLVGGEPSIGIALRPLHALPGVPNGGFLGAIGKSCPVEALRQALGQRLELRKEEVSLAYAGRDLQDDLTLRDNGIVEPGAAARRNGLRIELVFALPNGVVPGRAARAREAEEQEAAERAARGGRRERERLLEAAEVNERAHRRDVRARAAEAAEGRRGGAALGGGAVFVGGGAAEPAPHVWVAPPPVPAPAPRARTPEPRRGGGRRPMEVDGEEPAGPAEAAGTLGAAVAAAAAGARAPHEVVPEQATIRCLPVGGHAADGSLTVQTRLSISVADLSRQLCRLLGVAGGDSVTLVFEGHVLAEHATLREAGIADGAELAFFFAVPPGGHAEPRGEGPAEEAPGEDGHAVAEMEVDDAGEAEAADEGAAADPSGMEVEGGKAPPDDNRQLDEDITAEDFLREFAQKGGWPIAPPEWEVDEIRKLTRSQLKALRHVRKLCQEKHMEALPRAIERAEKLGFSEFDFVRTLEWVREQAPLIIHVNLSRYLAALSKDTHYRNQFETQASGGKLDNSYRRKVESELFGGTYDSADPFEKVKYGVINFRNSERGVEICHQYGDDYFVLKGVRLRTTLSSADTFATRTLATPDYYAHIFDGYSENEFLAALKLGCRQTLSISDGSSGSYGEHYKEAQYHGEVCLERHVATIVLHPKHRSEGKAFEQQVMALQKVCGGCPVLWMDNQAEMEQVRAIPKSLREVSYEQQSYSPGPASGWQPDVERLQVLQRLRDGMLRHEPAMQLKDWVAEEKVVDFMTEAEIVALLKTFVPDLESRVAPRSDETPVRSLIVSSYRGGLPNYPTSVRQHLARCLRFVLRAVRDSERDGTLPAVRIRSICVRLVDAFEACQAAQARVIEALVGELREGPPVEREVRAMSAELREQTLDRMVLHLHREAARDDVAPRKQLAHLANEYRRLLRMTSIDHAEADRHAGGGPGEAVTRKALHSEEEVAALFRELCEPADLVEAFLQDVNQPSGAPFRRIDRDCLSRWAGEHKAIGHRVYYDASMAFLYNGKPLPGDETQPFLHSQVAAEILCELLDPTEGREEVLADVVAAASPAIRETE